MQHRQRQFYEREQVILTIAEQLLLESGDGDLTLDNLALELDIAKGTLYKHFVSKDELFLHLLINYEKRLADTYAINDDPSAQVARIVLQPLLYPRRAVAFHQIEERLASTSVGLNKRFDELYKIRRLRMREMLQAAQSYLDNKNSTLNTRDYVSAIWAIGQGGASLLNSSFYQRYLGRRDTLIISLVAQALQLPLLYPKPASPKPVPEPSVPKPVDNFSPFGKLSPPVL